jgi:very-short-patch-repair endonuclease
LKPVAREHRAEATGAESILWASLRRRAITGFKFRRQHAIDRYIVDFYCPRARLVVEVDGPIHDLQQAEDAARQEHLESLNLRVLRFSNDEVTENLENVLSRIEAALTTSPPAAATPSPEPGEGD